MGRSRIDQRQLQILSLLGLCIAIICITIAYATMSEKLSITGTAKMEGAEWNIYFEGTSASTVGKATYVLPVIELTTLRDFYVSFSSLGDQVTFQFEVVNGGNMPAQLASIIKENAVCDSSLQSDADLVCSHLIYKLIYEDGQELKEGDLLGAGGRQIVKLVLEYPQTAPKLPKKAVTIRNLGIDLIYNQA